MLGSSGYYPALIYTALALAFFLFRTLHLRVEPEVYEYIKPASARDPNLAPGVKRTFKISITEPSFFRSSRAPSYLGAGTEFGPRLCPYISSKFKTHPD